MSKSSTALTAKKAAPAFTPLDFKPVDFSLTAGTDIPAPLESPPQTPARPPTPGGGPLSSHPTSPATTPPPKNPSESERDSSSTDNKNAHLNGAQKAECSMSPTLNHPLSPAVTAESQAASKRSSSMRRFLGFKGSPSNDNLRNGNSLPSRPMSPETTVSGSTVGRRRKSGSWFNKRRSGMFGISKLDENQAISPESLAQEQQQNQQKKGPPPPSLPSFQSLGTALDGGALGADDMFKNIK